ncbi:MAG: heat-inducible transcriptional repressor HrcA [Cyanobacteria bacterium QH_8_48_120]|jgi:heat-inducible transcriptional repressor|nr:MAG: heat-inducible transcriptional repressor HrcA [Cyanobacteria bacterium QH_1_48_107]PSO55601.1 MAG: heat-inducible transcriptional repressor HrcA [Cyanobacteria bacterium QH_10_48_56]PSO61049.1 MAG: heat-inducible transcriptional repressor HrcA [Cyanobacteria bacterium QH_7_48_89]PSO64232.1 MAG: heat-inducible transcriptional repressor HrcA [Cyanobacteria bacterium QH_6_48_35]PSO66166.1 MAG: heat-inducible transcriptional repressor HrcA [Cyanobacteria bacterium QH_2_48_84]PSO68591.1 MAG
MPHQLNLTERYQQILWATIRQYVATAEPVSSKSLAQEYDFTVSSATIRNAMGRLEKAGLLYQPHTSAGRVPSDSGYRIYVDELITPDGTLGHQTEQLLNQQINWEAGSVEALLRGSAQILATLSGYIAFITLPQNPTHQLRHLQLVQVDPGRVMLIVVTDAYDTQSVLMELPASASDKEQDYPAEGELEILSNFLNSKLRGRSLLELATLDWGELDREFERYADFLRSLLKTLIMRVQAPASTEIMIRGISEVLRQPEFSQLQQVQMLLHLLEEEQDQLWPLIFELPESDASARRVTVRIGSENPLEPMRTCTLISANYRQGDYPVGSVGLIGPTRMLYENAIALVEAATDYLSDTLSLPMDK